MLDTRNERNGPINFRRQAPRVSPLPVSPSVARNRGPILEVLRDLLGDARAVLEIASGTGEHAVWLCTHLPQVTWQPTDIAPAALDAIAARQREAALANLLPPKRLDVTSAEAWDIAPVDAMVAINMIHISPWHATEGLLRGAAGMLPRGGVLYLYGPFRRAGQPLAASNAAFDVDLRARDAAWGLRELETVVATAERHGLHLADTIDMPANNLSVAFRRR